MRHVEIAWNPNPHWTDESRQLRETFPDLDLGVASVCGLEGVRDAVDAGFNYVVSPVLDVKLVAEATASKVAMVPGVMSPTEVHQAQGLGCPLVKLFPASALGPAYWRRLSAPLGPLPFCVAAGGLGVEDVIPWLESGVDAVALGASLDHPSAWSELGRLVQTLERLHQRLH